MTDSHHKKTNFTNSMSLLGIVFVLSFSVFLFFSLFPFAPSFTYSFFDRHRLLQAGFLCVFLLARLICSNPTGAAEFTGLLKYQCAIILVCCLGFVSALVSDEQFNSLFYTLHLALLFFLALAISRLNPLVLRYSLVVLVVVHSTLISYCLLYLVFAVSDGVKIRPEVIYFGFDNIRFFNQVQIFVLPLLLLGCKSPRVGGLSAIFLTANLILMFLGGGLGIALSWVLILVLFGLFVNERKLFARTTALTVFCFAASYGLQSYLMFINDGGSAGVSTTSGGRTELWLVAFSQFEWVSLFVGSGPGLFEARMSSGIQLSHPHNSLLELALEWGVIAALVIFALVVHTLIVSKKRLAAEAANSFTVNHSVLLAWVGGLSLSFVSGVIVMPLAQTLLFVFWGVLLASQSANNETKHRNAGLFYAVYWRGYFARGLAIIVVIGYAYLVFWTYCEIDPFAPAFQGPRFWLNGERYLP